MEYKNSKDYDLPDNEEKRRLGALREMRSGRLTFNSELLEKRRSLIDYVVLHELLHMKVPNHGKLFKSLMFVFLPDWEKCNEQSKEAL